jgi:hypothetical protein
MNTIDTEKTTTPEPGAPQPKATRTAAKKGRAKTKPTKPTQANKAAGKPKADRANKSASHHVALQRTWTPNAGVTRTGVFAGLGKLAAELEPLPLAPLFI